MKYSKYTFFIGLLACFSFYKLAAQLPPNDWLAKAWKDSLFKKMEAIAEFRAKHPLTIPWLDKWEFRTQTNDFNIKQQQYTLRFSAADPAEVSFRKRLEDVDIKLYRQLAQDALHDALTARYRYLIENYWMGKQENLFKEQQTLHQKKTLYLESLFQHQLDAELKDLVQAYRKNEKIRMESGALKETKKWALQKSGYGIGSGDLSLDGFHWIQPAQIRALLKDDPGTIPVSASYARLLQNKSQAELESIRIKEDGWNFLEFFQARWRNNTNDELIREKISLGAGFRLPFPGGKRRDQNLIVLEKMQIESEVDQYITEYHLKSNTLKLELESILDQLEVQQNQLRQFENKFKQPALLSNPLVRTQDILFIDETILDWKEELVEIEKEMMEKYLEYLDHTRLISIRPYKNYLEAALGELTIFE